MTAVLRKIGSVADGFFAWWLTELAGLVPTLWWASRRHSETVLTIGSNGIVVSERTGEAERTLGDVAADAPDQRQRLDKLLHQENQRARTVTVRLGNEFGLQKVFDLPLAAKDDLQQLLRFEMDRLTPFRAEEVLFAQRVLASDLTNRRIAVELQLAPKRIVEQALATAQRLGLSPARLELAQAKDATDGREPLNLLRDEQNRQKSRGRRAFVLLALMLMAVGIAAPLWRLESRLENLKARVGAARAGAEESLALRERIDQLTAVARFLIAAKDRHPTVTEILAELTRLIPDQAHLVEIELRDGSVQLHGYASSASELIGSLGQSRLFRAPQFRSPVVQDPSSGLERFHLSVELIDQHTGW